MPFKQFVKICTFQCIIITILIFYAACNFFKNRVTSQGSVSQLRPSWSLRRGQNNSSFYIKETLLNWAIGGSGNEFIEADRELKEYYLGFQKVLRSILPKVLGFKEITIRNYEIVLVTESGDFMLDAVSGGVSAIIDLAWQIYTYANKGDEYMTVLIDEIDNHLHPNMQRSILPDLLVAFPNVQFIVSTHSPLVVGSVKDSNVYALLFKKENGTNRVYSEKLDLINKAKTATEILNEVLGVPFTMPLWVVTVPLL